MLLLKKRMNFKLTSIGEFFKSFEWPAASKVGQRIFDDRNLKSITDADKGKRKNPTFSCAASDALGSFGLIQ